MIILHALSKVCVTVARAKVGHMAATSDCGDCAAWSFSLTLWTGAPKPVQLPQHHPSIFPVQMEIDIRKCQFFTWMYRSSCNHCQFVRSPHTLGVGRRWVAGKHLRRGWSEGFRQISRLFVSLRYLEPLCTQRGHATHRDVWLA